LQVTIKDPEKVELSTMGMVYSHYYTYLVRTEHNPIAASANNSPGPGHRSTSLGPLTAGLAAAAAAATALQPGTPPSDTAEGPRTPAAGGGTVVEVRRRFSDFEGLHSLLKAHYPGYFIPPVPDKAFFDSRFAGDSFLKVRKVDLQVGHGVSTSSLPCTKLCLMSLNGIFLCQHHMIRHQQKSDFAAESKQLNIKGVAAQGN
jgi:hypothetical protein